MINIFKKPYKTLGATTLLLGAGVLFPATQAQAYEATFYLSSCTYSWVDYSPYWKGHYTFGGYSVNVYFPTDSYAYCPNQIQHNVPDQAGVDPTGAAYAAGIAAIVLAIIFADDYKLEVSGSAVYVPRYKTRAAHWMGSLNFGGSGLYRFGTHYENDADTMTFHDLGAGFGLSLYNPQDPLPQTPEKAQDGTINPPPEPPGRRPYSFDMNMIYQYTVLDTVKGTSWSYGLTLGFSTFFGAPITEPSTGFTTGIFVNYRYSELAFIQAAYSFGNVQKLTLGIGVWF